MSASKEMNQVLENVVMSQQNMLMVMDKIIEALQREPAPIEELVAEILTPLAEAIRLTGSKVGLELPSMELAPEPETEVPGWAQMDATQQKAHVDHLKKTRMQAKRQRTKEQEDAETMALIDMAPASTDQSSQEDLAAYLMAEFNDMAALNQQNPS